MLKYSVPQNVTVTVDAQRLTQIITNGLSNAGKFTSSGYVAVSVTIYTASKDDKVVCDREPHQIVSPNADRPASQQGLLARMLTADRSRTNSRTHSRALETPRLVGDPERHTVAVQVRPQISNARSIASDQDELRGKCFVVIDVFNTGGGLGSDPERLFIPFKGAGLDGRHLWSTASRRSNTDTTRVFRDVWRETLKHQSLSDFKTVEETRFGQNFARGPVTASTGLGLPLSREFASVCGGWLSLEDDSQGRTHFWTVIPTDSCIISPMLSPAEPSVDGPSLQSLTSPGVVAMSSQQSSHSSGVMMRTPRAHSALSQHSHLYLPGEGGPPNSGDIVRKNTITTEMLGERSPESSFSPTLSEYASPHLPPLVPPPHRQGSGDSKKSTDSGVGAGEAKAAAPPSEFSHMHVVVVDGTTMLLYALDCTMTLCSTQY